jgi:hypothetical protein
MNILYNLKEPVDDISKASDASLWRKNVKRSNYQAFQKNQLGMTDATFLLIYFSNRN